MLSKFAATSLGKELIHRMKPVRDESLVLARQAETGEARQLLIERGEAPLGVCEMFVKYCIVPKNAVY